MDFRIGKVAGAPIIISENLLLFTLIYCGFTAVHSITTALMALLAIVTITGCILLHEIGHVLAAQHYHIRTTDITLNFYGGVASSRPNDWRNLMDRPKEAAIVWLCGPLVTFMICCTLTLIMLFLAPKTAFYNHLAWVRNFNAVIGVFNMLPIYPLDGGGILYSILRMYMEKYKAISIASKIGMFGAVGLLILAILTHALFLGIMSIAIFFMAKNAPNSPSFNSHY